MKNSLLIAAMSLLLVACNSSEDPEVDTPAATPYLQVLDGKTFHKVGKSGASIENFYSVPVCEGRADFDIDTNGTDEKELIAYSFDKDTVTLERRWYKDTAGCMAKESIHTYDVIDTYAGTYTIISGFNLGNFEIEVDFNIASRVAKTAAGAILLNSNGGTCGKADYAVDSAVALTIGDVNCSGNRMRAGWEHTQGIVRLIGRHINTPNEALEVTLAGEAQMTFGNPVIVIPPPPITGHIQILDGKTFYQVGNGGTTAQNYSVPKCVYRASNDIDGNGTNEFELIAYHFDKSTVTVERRWYKDKFECITKENIHTYDVIDTYKANYVITSNIDQGNFLIDADFNAPGTRVAVTTAGAALLNSNGGTCGKTDYVVDAPVALVSGDVSCTGARMRIGWENTTGLVNWEGRHMTSPNEALELSSPNHPMPPVFASTSGTDAMGAFDGTWLRQDDHDPTTDHCENSHNSDDIGVRDDSQGAAVTIDESTKLFKYSWFKYLNDNTCGAETITNADFEDGITVDYEFLQFLGNGDAVFKLTITSLFRTLLTDAAVNVMNGFNANAGACGKTDWTKAKLESTVDFTCTDTSGTNLETYTLQGVATGSVIYLQVHVNGNQLTLKEASVPQGPYTDWMILDKDL